MVNELITDGEGTIIKGYHPSADDALNYLRGLGPTKLSLYVEAFTSTQLSNPDNKSVEILGTTLKRLLNGDPTSDRYLLGLAWAIRRMEDAGE